MLEPATTAGATELVRSDSRRRRRILLDAATELFVEVGYEAASLNDLVARAGGSKSSIYSYFRDKQGLFVAVVDDMVHDMLVPIEMLEDEHIDIAEHLFAMAEHTLNVLTSPKGLGLSRIVYMESIRIPSVGRAFYENGPNRAIKQLATFLQRKANNGSIQCEDPVLAAEFFWGMLLHKPMLQGMCSITAPMSPRRRANYVRKVVHEFLSKFTSEP